MKRMLRARTAVISAAICLSLTQGMLAYGGEDESRDAPVRVERVALFKNGMAFLWSGATLPDDARTVRLGQLPVPAFGTFWVGYAPEVRLRTLVASMEEVTESVPVQGLGQLLQINAGQRVILRTGPGEQDKIEGVLMATEEPAVPEPTSPYFMDTHRRDNPYGRSSGGIAASLLLIRTGAGLVAMNPGSVIRADFARGDVIQVVPVKQKRPSIRMELEAPAGGAPISVSCLARGVTWAPGYLLDLSDPKTARFSAHAVIINELADFQDVQLELVTGYPNIKFGDVLNPIAMSQNLEGFLNALASGRSESSRGGQGLMMQQARMANVAAFDEIAAAPLPGYSTAAEGEVSEDLFFYPVKSFSLKRGETAWLPLFTADMPYRHIYTWRIGDYLDPENRYQTGSERPEGKPAEEVWHSCRLVNSLKIPLTTAAAEFVKDGRFTGQDVCYYTAPGAETTVRISRAMNVLAEQAEIEVERVRNAAVFFGYQYDQVKVQGELRLRSRLEQPVTVEVAKELSGEVLQSTPSAKDVKTAKGLKQVNPKHILTWEQDLQPGEERKLLYVYQVYIRN